jgi:site-specific DNA-methyltransferase (adenine-specific)
LFELQRKPQRQAGDRETTRPGLPKMRREEKLKPTWQSTCGRVRLYNADCEAVLPEIATGSVDLILTDPPYGMTDLAWDTVVPLERCWPAWRRVAKPKAAFVITASQPYTAAVVMSNAKHFRTEWIWRKNNGSNFATTKWHLMKEHESVLVFGDGPTTYNAIKQPRVKPIKTGVRRRNASGKACETYAGISENREFKVEDGEYRVPSSVQDFNVERGIHPNQKPVTLCGYFVQTYSNINDVVLDPFMGSASTGVAAVNTLRQFIGIEKDPAYFAKCVERIEAALAEMAFLN